MDMFYNFDSSSEVPSNNTASCITKCDMEVIHHKDESGNLRLSDNFTVKASEDDAVLLNLKTRERFNLNEEQVDFVKSCDGIQTKAKIVSQYDEKSVQVVEEFIVNLRKIGAIEYNSEPREIKINRVPTPRLQMVHFEPFSKCNMSCIHCYQGDRYDRKKDNLTLNEIKELIKQMKDMQVEGVSISGGEPFVDLIILDAAAYIEKCDMKVISFFTNGTLISKDIIERVKELRSKPTFFISVDSITGYGMKFRSMNQFQGDEAVKRTIKAIKMLVKNGFDVVVNTALNICNIQDLEKMYEMMRKLNIRSWRIGYPKRTGSFANKDYQSFEAPFKIILERCLKLLHYHFAKGQPFDLQIEYLYRKSLIENFHEVVDDDYVCDYENRREGCCIKPNGDVVSCAYCCDQVLGNIKQQSLWDIWYSDRMRAIKNLRVKDIQDCKDCEIRNLCATGCRANAYFLGGEFEKSKDFYACEAVKFFKERVMPLVKSFL